MQEARQAWVKARRRHHLCVLEVTCRHHRLCVSLGEACEVIELDEIPLEEEEEWAFEPEKLQLPVEVRCPGPEGNHLVCLEAKGMVSEG